MHPLANAKLLLIVQALRDACVRKELNQDINGKEMKFGLPRFKCAYSARDIPYSGSGPHHLSGSINICYYAKYRTYISSHI